MLKTLEKIKRFEEYLAFSQFETDPVVEHTIDKLISREIHRLSNLKDQLTDQLTEFEKSYNFSSNDFYHRYESGELGDSMDFMEWAATVEMLVNLNKQMSLLDTPVYQ